MKEWDSNISGIPNTKLSWAEISDYENKREKVKKLFLQPQSLYDKDSIEVKRVFDTREFGKSNLGHRFGDHLNPEQRRLVIEFLRSVSGRNVLPE